MPECRRRRLCLAVWALVVVCAGPALAGEITVPVDVGVGPAFYHGGGPLFRRTGGGSFVGQYGLKISLAAIIKQEVIRRNIHRVPKRYRRMARGIKQIRYRPSIFIPDALIISPKVHGTGIYGVTWRPFGLRLPLYDRGTSVVLSAGALLTAAFVHSDVLASGNMFFLRPGLDVGGEVEIPITDNFLISFGWNWQVYIPQIVGGGLLETTFDPAGLDNSIWNLAQAFLKLHFRFPYTTRI